VNWVLLPVTGSFAVACQAGPAFQSHLLKLQKMQVESTPLPPLNQIWRASKDQQVDKLAAPAPLPKTSCSHILLGVK
jgi:hypothetical protein